MIKKYKSIPIGVIIGITIPLLTSTGALFVKMWSIADAIATKSELSQLRSEVVADFKRTDEAIAKSVAANKLYTDEKAMQVKIESFDHSDKNKLGLEAKVAELHGQLAFIVTILNELRIDSKAGRHK